MPFSNKVVTDLFYWMTLLLLMLDQITKLSVRIWMELGETQTIWAGILQFSYYENSGAARSSFQGYGRLFGIVAIFFIWGILLYRKRMAPNSRLLDLGLAFLAAGAAGNGIERLLFGKVTDFLVFGSGDGILNIADLSINMGILLLIADHFPLAKRSKEKQST